MQKCLHASRETRLDLDGPGGTRKVTVRVGFESTDQVSNEVLNQRSEIRECGRDSLQLDVVRWHSKLRSSLQGPDFEFHEDGRASRKSTPS